MDPETVIKVTNLTKKFEIPHERRNSLKSFFMNPFKKIKKDIFNALDDVSFEIKHGEFVGIIGRNGSGKSTLLKIIAEIYAPTSGKSIVNGTLVPFLELGIGFNYELSGRENIFLNGTILGMSRKHIKSKFDEIVDFAEVREFIDMPVKNYSNGMAMRLAFSIAVQVKADIYLLDEIMGVGDTAFQGKSLAKMKDLLSGGSTVLLVSHSMESIKTYCKRVIFMQNGRVIFDGNVDEGVQKYLNTL